MCKIALKSNYAYIDTVGEDDEETHVKVCTCTIPTLK